MNTTLCFDFGNTRLKCAVFNNRDFIQEIVLDEASTPRVEALIEEFKPEKTILSSVINHPETLEDLLKKNSRFHKLSYTSKLPLTTPVGKPETIGADRLAIMAAAVDLYPHQHSLSISLGTCITYNYVNRANEFLGGSISPGMQMRFRAMHEQTALLPLIKASHEFSLVGYDTKTNLLSGVILGMACEIDGIIKAYQEKYENLQVLLTGGDQAFFTPLLKSTIYSDPYLLYRGLYAISEQNNA
jgi:type III pantothenate kinase